MMLLPKLLAGVIGVSAWILVDSCSAQCLPCTIARPGATEQVSSAPGSGRTVAPRDELLERLEATIVRDPALFGVTIKSWSVDDDAFGQPMLLHVVGTVTTPAQVELVRSRVIAWAAPIWGDIVVRDAIDFSELSVAPPPSAAGIPPVVEVDHVAMLVRAIQRGLEFDPRLNGAIVLGVTLPKPADGGPQLLTIDGRLVLQDQVAALNEVVAAAVRQDDWWKGKPEIKIDEQSLIIAPVTVTMADFYYGVGVDSFFAGQYVTADLAFMRAVADAPAADGFRYWRVLTALVQGDAALAEARLVPLIRRHPAGSREAPIAREFERIQGPLRWSLLALEKRIVLNQIP